MPTLNWIGKEAVVEHHRHVPTRLLECDAALSAGDPDAEKLLVEGDNLEALKDDGLRSVGPFGMWIGPFPQGVALGFRVTRLRRGACAAASKGVKPESAMRYAPPPRRGLNPNTLCTMHRRPEGAKPESPGQRPGYGAKTQTIQGPTGRNRQE
jgi:hypothetical protein